jgi:hypothetical protein
MTRRLAAIARALRTPAVHNDVHFHPGGIGAPFACYDPRCTSPAIRRS